MAKSDERFEGDGVYVDGERGIFGMALKPCTWMVILIFEWMTCSQVMRLSGSILSLVIMGLVSMEDDDESGFILIVRVVPCSWCKSKVRW